MTGPRRFGAAMVALAALLAGCGGDSSSDGSAPRSSVAGTSAARPAAAAPTTTAVDLVTRPPAPTSATAVAAAVRYTEGAIRDPSITGDALARTGHEQQVAYRAWSAHTEWDAAVLATLPADLAATARANVAAARRLRELVRTPRREMPAWRIVPARPADELRRYYDEGERAYGIPWQYLAAVNLTETRMGRLRGTSTAGAQGPMQFIPSTWARYGKGDINSDRDAILAAARYLAANGGKRGDMGYALYRYNPTSKYVDAVMLYAQRMEADERAYRGYYHWQVYYLTHLGDAWLRVGYSATRTRPVTPADVR